MIAIVRKPFFWAARKGWYLRVSNDDGGLTTVRLADTRSDAYDEWDRMKTASRVVTTQTVTVEAIVSAYLASLKERSRLGKLSAATVTRRTDYVSPFLVYIGSLDVSSLKPLYVSEWLATMTTWNSTTQGDAGSIVKRAMKWAWEQGRIPTNPLINWKRGAPAKSREYVLTSADDRSLFANCWPGYGARRVTSFRSVLLALRLSGCRPSEIAGLQVEDFDGETWTIKAHKNRKKQHPRVIYLSPCLQTLSKILARGRQSGPLFRTQADRPWQYSDMRRRFERLRKRAKVDPSCVLYSFRHTWITQAMVAGVDVATVAAMAGTSIQMIDRHYGHLRQERSHLMNAAVKILASKNANKPVLAD